MAKTKSSARKRTPTKRATAKRTTRARTTSRRAPTPSSRPYVKVIEIAGGQITSVPIQLTDAELDVELASTAGRLSDQVGLIEITLPLGGFSVFRASEVTAVHYRPANL